MNGNFSPSMIKTPLSPIAAPSIWLNDRKPNNLKMDIREEIKKHKLILEKVGGGGGNK